MIGGLGVAEAAPITRPPAMAGVFCYEPGIQWLDRSWARAHAHASGRVYPNFPDPDLDDWATAYHGGNAERLRAVKRRYDPERVFRFPQAI